MKINLCGLGMVPVRARVEEVPAAVMFPQSVRFSII